MNKKDTSSYEAAIDVFLVGVVGMYLTSFDMIKETLSPAQRTSFSLLMATGVFSVSYLARKFFIHNKFPIKFILTVLLFMFSLTIFILIG